MITILCRVLLILLAVFSTACAHTLHQQLLSSAEDGQYGLEKLPVTKLPHSLSTDIIYNLLVGEVALQRQDLGLAYKHQLKSADLAKDAVAAERATRIALYQKDRPGALKAAELWVEYDPESSTARQMLVMLHMQLADAESALKHLKQLVTIKSKDEGDGFVQAVVAVASGKDNKLALKLMRSLAEGYQSNADARYAVALVALMANELDVAEAEVRQAVRLNPEMEKAHILLGRIYTERDDAVGAITVMKQALKRAANSKALRSAYARLLIDLDRPKLAYEQFLYLSKLVPDDVNVKFSLGVIALQVEEYKQAESHFKELLKSNSRVGDASFYIGRIAEAEAKPAKAMEWYGKVKSGKYMFNAQVSIVGLVAEHESLEKARVMLAGMRTRMPDRSVDLYLLEGDILREHSSHHSVVELLNAALIEHPDDIGLLYARALSASAMGKVDVLERDIRFILKQKPNHADALNALGYSLADHTNRYQEALDYIKRALALKPESPAILDSMGWVQYRLGNQKEALHYLRRAFDKVQDVEIAAHLIELLWVTGKKQEAQNVMQGALKKHPDNKYLLKTIKRLGI